MSSRILTRAFPDYRYLLPDAPENLFAIERYPNGELTVRLNASVPGKTCVIVGTIGPPDENLLSLCELAYTLKKEGAAKVVALLPYLAYAREDKDEPGKSYGTALIGQLLEAAGVDEVCTIDVHSPASEGLFPIPLHSFSPAETWAREIPELMQPGATIAAPDQGAIERCKTIAKAAGLSEKVTFIEKRHTDGIVHQNLNGPVAPNMVIVDDILDTGKTLASCAERLRQNGATQIMAAVSHGLFTGNEWQRIWDAGIQKLYCLDTTPATRSIGRPNIQIVPSMPLINVMLASLQKRGSSG